jgi:hypothetical protein
MTHLGLRAVGLVVATALVVPACAGASDNTSDDDSTAPTSTSSAATTEQDAPITEEPAQIPGLIEDGLVSQAALDAALTSDGEVNVVAQQAFVAEFSALSIEQQEVVMADLSLRTELLAASISGLEDAVGGRAATSAALSGAMTQIRDQSDAAGVAAAKPAGLRQPLAPAAASAPSGGTVAAVGLFMGFVALSTIGTVVIESTNTFAPGENDVRESDGTVIAGGLEEVGVEMNFTGQQDGVDVVFNAGAVIHPCPEADGSFTIKVLIDVKADKAGVGQNATMELTINGTVDDNAELASSNVENHTQWSDFGGGKGQFVDFTMSGPGGFGPMTTNRTGGAVTDEFVRTASALSTLMAFILSDRMLDAAQKAWKSGRCVELKVTPSAGPDGLTPSQVVDVLAEPRSKIDGAPTGGNVTATLSSGGASVDPDGSPVPADANSTYTAPNEVDKKGTVSYESRSRRGIGKASITFSTAKPAAYLVVGGLEDWQVNQVVCDVMAPFTLTSPGVGSAEFSGGLSGTYSASGVFNFQYAGTYQISLEDGLGSPGSMIGTSGGTIAGEAGSGSENYVLTPTTC